MLSWDRGVRTQRAMKCLSAIGQGLLAGLLIAAIPVQAAVVGATGGRADVTPTGAAIYGIPITIPPGIASMEPKLALTYSSQVGNGQIGIGWALSGLSAITRCPMSLVQDGTSRPVKYDAADKYCLDGQRLVAVNGAYGANGTEYRTELESYSRIISYGNNGYGPLWFKVWTKSGQLFEYGNTADSAIEVQNGVPIKVWAVNKISDIRGNYLTVTYAEDNASGQFAPVSIAYTGNAAAGKAPSNTVSLLYATRPDIVTMYDSTGSPTRSTWRLTNVQTFAGTALVKDYRLAYEATVSANTGRSRLASVTECDGAGTCLNPTVFTWEDGAPGLSNWAASVRTVTGNWKDGFEFYPGDYNGDGVTDLILVGKQPNGAGTGTPNTYFCRGPQIASGNSCSVLLDNTGFISSFGAYTTAYKLAAQLFPSYSVPEYDRQIYLQPTIFPGDYNGDGITDLYLVGESAAYFCPGPGIASGNNCKAVTNTAGLRGTYDILTGDYNGDGITDLFLMGANGSYYCEGPGIASANNCKLTVAASNNWKTSFGTDAAVQSCSQPGGGGMNGGPIYCSKTYYAGNVSIYQGDYDGDGRSDLFLAHDQTNWFCSGATVPATTGCVAVTPSGVNSGWKMAFRFLSGDYNGDGITDLFLASDQANYFCAGPGISKGNNCVAVTGTGSGWKTAYNFIPGDYDGDGRTDLFLAGDQANYVCENAYSQATFTCRAVTGTGSGWKSAFNFIPGDFDGNGIADLYLVGTAASFFTKGAAHSDHLLSVTNGLGVVSGFSYLPLTNSAVYTKGAGAVYPVMDVQVPMYVVNQVSVSDGIGGTFSRYYSYVGAKSHVKGGGFLGFASTSMRDSANMAVWTNYAQDYPHQGLPVSSAKYLYNGTTNPTLNTSVSTYSYGTNPAWGAQYHSVQLAQSIEKSYELASGGAAQGPLVTATTTCNSYDAYGNATYVASWSADISCANPPAKTGVFVKETTSTFTNDTVNWFLGRLNGAVVTSTAP